jgi:mannose-6-phosphate isomerase
MDLYPLTFEPRFVPRIWGGKKMKELYNKALPEGAAIGESWEICDRPEFNSLVANGALKGTTLHQLMSEYGPHLVGEKVFGLGLQRFPLLVKLIDAREDLSVQVHPNDDYAGMHVGPDEPGKTEMWYLMRTDPGARIIAGLKPGTGPQEFKTALKDGRLPEVLNGFTTEEGDAVYVPAGRVHAVGRGCLLAEIQQNSDTTYRVYDYGRLENGKPRDLHVQQALETIRFDAEMAGLPDKQPQKMLHGDDYNHTVLAASPYFTVEKVWANPVFRPGKTGDSFHILMGIKGRGTLEGQGVEAMNILPGQFVLVPARLEWQVRRNDSELQLLWARP